MVHCHAVFGIVEEMVEQVLMPGWGMRGGEEAEAHGKHVHIYEGDLGPGVEGWGESNACATTAC